MTVDCFCTLPNLHRPNLFIQSTMIRTLDCNPYPYKIVSTIDYYPHMHYWYSDKFSTTFSFKFERLWYSIRQRHNFYRMMKTKISSDSEGNADMDGNSNVDCCYIDHNDEFDCEESTLLLSTSTSAVAAAATASSRNLSSMQKYYIILLLTFLFGAICESLFVRLILINFPHNPGVISTVIGVSLWMTTSK